ncbi:helix-turn-helix domain-containing protein [Candidatus Albibeggiatoa sp. nov. NOAA]|uniref:helix-turn-helix domain-containing protein n=1 Tax=Candidatus Albibeggiatoa sp. nov. NOAA TaxID=3162724 RepID=UPI003301D128|nr:helix-turn-helix domain containing protein [Thiotrichaceae bacterium]
MKEGIVERLKILIDHSSNGNKSAFTRKINVSLSTFKNYLDSKRTDIVSAETLIKIYEATNVNITWLLTGKGEMYLNGQEQNFDLENILQHLTPQQKQELLNRSQEMYLMNNLKQRVEDMEKRLDEKS